MFYKDKRYLKECECTLVIGEELKRVDFVLKKKHENLPLFMTMKVCEACFLWFIKLNYLLIVLVIDVYENSSA